MKVISIWQPFASLAAYGYKVIETRTWPAPQSMIGQVIGIASTKNIKPEQRAHFEDPDFQAFYSRMALPQVLEDMPFGYLLGTATFDSQHPVTEELLAEISAEEQQYGWYEVPGKTVWAWMLTDAKPLPHPIPIRGAQGIYDWHGVLPDADMNADRPQDIRSSLRVVS